MSIHAETVTTKIYTVICDNCGDEVGSATSIADARNQAAFEGWRLVQNGDDERDLCEDCYNEWNQG